MLGKILGMRLWIHKIKIKEMRRSNPTPKQKTKQKKRMLGKILCIHICHT